jgi:hypothetical protein
MTGRLGRRCSSPSPREVTDPTLPISRFDATVPEEMSFIMNLFTRGFCLALSGSGLLGLAGCAEDNEAFIKAQAASAKGTIPGSRTAQAQSQEEYYQITPGVTGGAGMASGPRPDQGKGYPGTKRPSSPVAPVGSSKP